MTDGQLDPVRYGSGFEYCGEPVGLFRGGSIPHLPGRYQYEPYRGPGHHEMQTALKSGRRPRCSFVFDGQRTSFEVTECPDYGLIELAHFEITPA